MSWPSRIYCATKTLGVYYTGDFADPGTQPKWAAVNTGLPTTDVLQFALDPFEPADKQYCLLDGTRELYRRDDGGSWESILTSVQIMALTANDTWGYIVRFYVDKAVAGRLWVLWSGAYDFAPPVNWQTIYALYSDDWGATWTAILVSEAWMSPRGCYDIATCGDNVFIRSDNGSNYYCYYSSDKGANWATAGAPWDGWGDINPLHPTKAHYTDGSGNHKTIDNAGTVASASNPGPTTPDTMWFALTDADHHRIVSGGKIYTTTDSWATVNTPSAITPAPISIAPWSGADTDQMIVGLAPVSGSQPHTIGVLYGEDDTTAAGIAGTNCETTPFADSIPDTCGGVALGGVAAVNAPEYTTIKLLSLKPTQDRSEFVTRVYPRASGISLAVTTRTASGDYDLDAAAGYIVNTAAEVYGRRERVVTFTLDMPTGSDTDDESKVLAANALYDKGLEWLGQHDSIPTTYTAKVTGQTTLIESLTTIRLVTTTIVDGESVHSLDADFNIVRARNYLNNANKLEAELELSTLEREAVSDAQVIAEAVVNASKPSGGSSVASVSTVVSRVEGTADINGGTIDGTVIGQEDPANATFEDVLVQGDITLVGLLNGFDVSMLDPILEDAGKVFVTDGYGGGSYQVVSGSGTLDHDHSGDAGDGNTFDAANLTSGASTDGQVLTSDGAGNAAWEDPPAGGDSAWDWQELTDGANIAWDLDDGSAHVTLEGNRTLDNPTNMVSGAIYWLKVIQDETGGRTLDYGTAYLFPLNVEPTLSTWADAADIIMFACDGTHMYGITFAQSLGEEEPYDPDDIDDLSFWAAARLETTFVDDDDVDAWTNQTGGTDATNATEAYRPVYKTNIINGQPILRFDGSNDDLVITGASYGDNVTIFLVIKPDGTSPVGLIDTAPNQANCIRNYSAGNLEWHDTAPSFALSIANTSAVLLVFKCSLDSTRAILYRKNGAQISDNTNGSTTGLYWNNPRIGSINAGANGNYDGDLAEILIYGRALGSDEITSLEDWLNGIYDIW